MRVLVSQMYVQIANKSEEAIENLTTASTFVSKTSAGLYLNTLRVRKLSLNCLFAGRNNNYFDFWSSPGN